MVKWIRRLAAVVWAVLAWPVWGLEIVPSFVDGGGYSWDAVKRGVIERAIADWEAVIADEGRVYVTFSLSAMGADGYGALARLRYAIFPAEGSSLFPWSEGLDLSVSFNTDRFTGAYYIWWDPTPWSDGDQPAGTWDALTLARHELGHILGFTAGFYFADVRLPSQYDKWRVHVVGDVFDPGGLAVKLASTMDVSHVADPMDLMHPVLRTCIRKPISEIDLKMLALAYGYRVVPEPAAGLAVAVVLLVRRRRG